MIATVKATRLLEIPERFNGPPATANGGFACGAVARHVAGPAEVTLRRPPPVGTPLEVTADALGRVIVHDGDALVAHAGPADLSGLRPPVLPTIAQAREAMRDHPGFGRRHLLSDCFVCGPERRDGLGLHFGPMPGWPKLNAALLVGDATLPHHGDTLADEIAWSALDCVSHTPELSRAPQPSLLAAMAAEVLEPLRLGEPIVAVGWPLETEGRRHRAASALLDGDGRLLARARTLWIRLRGPGEDAMADSGLDRIGE
jgi:hypothetical protein